MLLDILSDRTYYRTLRNLFSANDPGFQYSIKGNSNWVEERQHLLNEKPVQIVEQRNLEVETFGLN